MTISKMVFVRRSFVISKTLQGQTLFKFAM